MRYFLRIRYKGTFYHGWQVQDNANSVQQAVNEALKKVLRSPIESIGCGRTDTGVHADDFYLHFDVQEKIANPAEIIRKLTAMKVADIQFRELIAVKDEAHARFDATSRTYKYYIIRERNPFYLDRAAYIYGDIDLEFIKNASRFLIGKKDFGAFAKSNTQVATNICTVSEASWEAQDELLIFTISADRFLRNMVRAIVGTLIDIGQGKLSMDQFQSIIDSKDRRKAGMSAPPQGLFLTRIVYPESIFLNP